jgi:Tetratricopeptide repeat.
MTGRYLAILKKYDQALLAYKAAVQIDPTSPSVEQEMRLVESRIGK